MATFYILFSDTYVKTYVMQGNKVMQKKKTSINKDGADPNYREKIKYSACNALGRHMKVSIFIQVGQTLDEISIVKY